MHSDHLVMGLMLAVLCGPTFGQEVLNPGLPNNPPLATSAELEVGTLNLRVGNFRTSELNNLLAQPNVAPPAARHIIQLNGPITPDRLQQLQQLGVQLGDYLPTYAYFADLQQANLAELAQTGFVMWAGEYKNDWKIDPEVGTRNFVTPERQAIAARGDVVVDVTLFEGESLQQSQALLAAIHGVHVHRSDLIAGNHTITMTMPLNALQQIAQFDFVQYIEECGEVTLRNDSNRWIVQSNQLNVTPLYNAGLRGEGQVVGILDGRVNQTHCSFIDSSNPIGPSHRKILAYNSSAGYAQHGTHVAGTAVGDAGAFAHTRGVAYMGKLVFNLTPSFTESAVRTALQTHHNQGARLHTNSWGNDGTTAYDALCRGIDDFAWLNEDSLVLLAVTNTSTLKNPVNAKNLLAVGASQDTPGQGNFCSGGTGPTVDGRRKPEIFAPGCSTNSSSGSGTSCSTAALTGTSMATPAVAGAGMLIRQYYSNGFYPTGAAVPGNAFTPTGALIKATLLNSAVDMTGISGYPSNQEGWGRVLADEALYFSGESRKLAVWDVRHSGGLTTGGMHDRSINVASTTQKLKVTLVWTEPAASTGAGNPVINDLDLEVIGPGGTYLGNVFSGGQSTTGGTKDPRNNVEQVHLNSPAVGQYTLRVRGGAVNQGVQGYALVVSGDVTSGPIPPANDLCANAPLVGAGNTAFTTVAASTDGPNESGQCNFNGYGHLENDVWFRYLTQCAGTATVSLCGANFDAKIAVYATACPSGPGQVIACNDNSCGLAPQVTFNVVNNTVYRIRVGGFNGATGSGTMSITCTPAPVCPADVTGDLQVNVNDLLAVINAWGPCSPPCPADCTPPGGDGQVNVNDLLSVINAWGPCP